MWRWNRQYSETSAYKIQTPGNYPEESIQHSVYLSDTYNTRCNVKVSGLSLLLHYCTSHCAGTSVSMSDSTAVSMSWNVPAHSQSVTTHSSHSVWCNHHKSTAVSMSCIIFVMSESTQKCLSNLVHNPKKQEAELTKWIRMPSESGPWAVPKYLIGSTTYKDGCKT